MKMVQRIIGAVNRVLYRATGGKVGGTMKGAPILLLTTRGRKSGKKRVMPLLYLRDDGNVVVVASSGGTPTSPGWFHNLKATPDVEIEIGRNRESRRARVASTEERARLWPRLVEMYPPYREYQKKTTREIPVVILEPR
jgi:F420H(2)-dependent quinone reductase